MISLINPRRVSLTQQSIPENKREPIIERKINTNNILISSIKYLLKDVFSLNNLLRGKSLIRIHIVPYSQTDSSENCLINKKQRNQHVSHLPKYKKMTNESLQEFKNELCPICHERFKLNEYYRTLPICNHSFHKKCVDKWLRKDVIHMRCPLCREHHTPDKWKTYSRYSRIS